MDEEAEELAVLHTCRRGGSVHQTASEAEKNKVHIHDIAGLAQLSKIK